jgi:hypothetical protein
MSQFVNYRIVDRIVRSNCNFVYMSMISATLDLALAQLQCCIDYFSSRPLRFLDHLPSLQGNVVTGERWRGTLFQGNVGGNVVVGERCCGGTSSQRNRHRRTTLLRGNVGGERRRGTTRPGQVLDGRLDLEGR